MKTLLLISAMVFGASAAMATQAESPGERLRAAQQNDVRIAGSCGSGMTYCSPGSYGPGGCYKQGYASCTAGLVCTGGTVACKPSNGGDAYCYKPGYGTCN